MDLRCRHVNRGLFRVLSVPRWKVSRHEGIGERRVVDLTRKVTMPPPENIRFCQFVDPSARFRVVCFSVLETEYTVESEVAASTKGWEQGTCLILMEVRREALPHSPLVKCGVNIGRILRVSSSRLLSASRHPK